MAGPQNLVSNNSVDEVRVELCKILKLEIGQTSLSQIFFYIGELQGSCEAYKEAFYRVESNK